MTPVARFLPLLAVTALLNCQSKKETASAERTVAAADTAAPAPKQVIIFFGNSLAAGYGLENTADAFPNRIAARIDSLALPYRVINAGLSGETTAGGRSRVGWILRQAAGAGRQHRQDTPAIFVLELGGNDGLRGIPLASSRANLQAIIDTVRQQNPAARIVIAGMQIPPNLGRTYTSEFRGMFAELATKNKAVLIPFLLEGVGGIPALNQPDGIHPNVRGHRLVAETVWKVIGPMLQPHTP